MKSEVRAQKSSRQKVREVKGPFNKPGFPRHGINLEYLDNNFVVQESCSKNLHLKLERFLGSKELHLKPGIAQP